MEYVGRGDTEEMIGTGNLITVPPQQIKLTSGEIREIPSVAPWWLKRDAFDDPLSLQYYAPGSIEAWSELKAIRG